MRGHSTRTFNAEHDKRKKKADTRNRFQHHIDLFGFTNSLLLTDLEIYNQSCPVIEFIKNIHCNIHINIITCILNLNLQ